MVLKAFDRHLRDQNLGFSFGSRLGYRSGLSREWCLGDRLGGRRLLACRRLGGRRLGGRLR